MLVQNKKSVGAWIWQFVWNVLMWPTSPKYVRTTALLTSIYQFLIAHCILFLVLLCLAHAEQMRRLLDLDIIDQKDNGFYNMAPFHNDLRLHTAAELADAIQSALCLLAGLAGVYSLFATSLFIGVYQNRASFIIPWLVFEFLGMIAAIVCIFMLKDTRLPQLFGGQVFYFILCYSTVVMNAFKWYGMQRFYQSVRTMNKLREIATVAIPCPAPGTMPYHFRSEHMSNGYKHILTDSPDGQC